MIQVGLHDCIYVSRHVSGHTPCCVSGTVADVLIGLCGGNDPPDTYALPGFLWRSGRPVASTAGASGFFLNMPNTCWKFIITFNVYLTILCVLNMTLN